MAEEAEKKKIAELYFEYDSNNLNKLNDDIQNLNKLAGQLKDKLLINVKVDSSGLNELNKNLIETLKKTGKMSEKEMEEAGKKAQKAYQTGFAREYGKQAGKEAAKLEATKLKQTQDTQKNIEEAVKKSEIRIQEYKEKTAIKAEAYNERQLESTKTLYDKIMSMGETYLLYQGFNALKQGIRETIDEMVKLESEMVQIDRVLNENGLNVNDYRDKLIQLAYDYGNSIDNVTDVALRLAQAGFNSNEVLALTEKTLLALNTAELNATEATSDMVAVMAQWGLMTGNVADETKNYADIIDKINKIADNYPTTSADLMEALKKTSSAFNLAGASIDETLATITAAEVASQRGGKAIGTALSNIIQQLKEAKKLDIAESLGLSFYTDDTKQQFKGIMEIFQEMSGKMQQLKDAGKENSVEMQNLLSIFTVFRRNIGSSLLGEMSGEDSTYFEVLKDSINATGYSLQENEKYLQTTEAAQQRFNAALLKLKTEVWDNQVKTVYRDLLNSGQGFLEMITKLINKVGLLPTTLGVVTASITALKGKIKVGDISKTITTINKLNQQISTTSEAIKRGNANLKGMSVSFKNYATSVKTGELSLKGYAGYLVTSTAKTVALTAASIALNAAISAGLGLAIGAITSAITNWIHASENAKKANEELMEQSRQNASEYSSQAESLDNLYNEYDKTISQYKKLKEGKQDTSESEMKLLEIQENINKELEGTGKHVNLISKTTDEYGKTVLKVNDSYENQLNIIKSISYEKKKQQLDELENAMKAARSNLESATSTSSFFFDTKNTEEAVNAIQESMKKMQEAGKEGTKEYKGLENQLKEIKDAQDKLNEATDAYMNLLGDMYLDTGKISEYSLNLSNIAETYSKFDGPNKLIKDLQELNVNFQNGTITSKKYFDGIQEKIKSIDFSAFAKLKEQANEIQRDASSITENITDVNLNAVEAMKGMAISLADQNEEINNAMIEGTNVATELTEEQIEELRAYEAIFAETTQLVAQNLSDLIASYESGKTSWVDYSKALGEAGESTLNLYTQLNNLNLDEQTNQWTGASDAVNEYANSLQNAINSMQGLSGMLTVIGDNYDYITEHATIAGEALFTASDIGTQAYKDLATNMANELNKMKNTNAEAYNKIVDDVFKATGDNANEVSNMDKYITDKLQNNADALNAGLNGTMAQAAAASGNISAGVGQILEKLGNAIENFDYNITGTLEGFTTKEIDFLGQKFNVPNGLKFKISGNSEGSSIAGLAEALKNFGSGLSSRGVQEFKYTRLNTSGGNYSPVNRTPIGTGSSSGSGGSEGSGGSKKSGGSGGSGGTSTYHAEKEAEEEYKNKLKSFTDFVTEREKLESNWVKRQKELGQLSNKDFLYITEQRINRYKKYLAEVEKMTWLSEEDKLKLRTEYQEKISDLEVDYLKYLEDNMNDEIKKIKENNQEKINLIKNEADERIKALKKVKDETSKIRDEEDYEEQRKKILEEISYWEQRTGREAQESLKKSKEKLSDLDQEWGRQLEDWSIEEQIQAIEDERDAEIDAIQKSEEEEIKSLQNIYDEKVRLYSETGQLIFEQSKIESSNLYKSYKENFVDPIMSDLDKIQNKISGTGSGSKTSGTASPAQYETYTIQKGDTLSGIAKRYNTTVSKLMEANPYITNANKIYAGKTLQIPKFHEGGIVGGNQEAFALLKPNEVILKPEWAEGINKLAEMAKRSDNQIMNTNTNITVKGDLVRIDASIKDKSDAEYLTRKVEKMLKDKFNINK